MREHAHLPAMVGFVRKHVAMHFHAYRPRLGPAIPLKCFDGAIIAQRFTEHLSAKVGAFGQCRTGLLWSAARPVELGGNLEVLCIQPDPLGAHIVHVREYRRNGAGVARWLGFPGGWVEVFDQKLVHSIIGGEELYGG